MNEYVKGLADNMESSDWSQMNEGTGNFMSFKLSIGLHVKIYFFILNPHVFSFILTTFRHTSSQFLTKQSFFSQIYQC